MGGLPVGEPPVFLLPQLHTGSSALLHFFLHLFGKKPRLATLFAAFQLTFFIGFRLEAFIGRAAAFFAASGSSDGNSKKQEEKQAKSAGEFHIL